MNDVCLSGKIVAVNIARTRRTNRTMIALQAVQ
jgi:hypothetical protein